MEQLKCKATIDKRVYTSEFALANNSARLNIEGLIFDFTTGKDCMSINIINSTNRQFSIQSLEVLVDTLELSDYSTLVLNPEYSGENIEIKGTEGIKNQTSYTSFLFSLIYGIQDNNSFFAGFLSSHTSRNYVRMKKNIDKISVYAVYDFINHCLREQSSLKLDGIFIESGLNNCRLLDDYRYRIIDEFPRVFNDFRGISKKFKDENVIKSNILYRRDHDEWCLSPGNSSNAVLLDRERHYPIDLNKKGIKEKILEELRLEAGEGIRPIYIKNIMPYINEAIRQKEINPYYEISNLLAYIKTNMPDSYLLFDDCPYGIAINNTDILISEVKFKNRGNVLKRMISRNHDFIDHSSIILSILQSSIFTNSLKFSNVKEKIRQTMEVMSMSLDIISFNNYELRGIAEDIDLKKPIISSIGEEDVFGLLRYGKKAVYIAIFNLSNKNSKFYWDFSSLSKEISIDGTAVDIYTSSNYLISKGKIYVRRVKPYDCCLIVRPLKREGIPESSIL